MNIRSKKGFTLMEMLIVVAIIAILVGIAIPVFNAQLEKARVAVDQANMRSAMSMAVTYAMTDDTKANADGVVYNGESETARWTITFTYDANHTMEVGGTVAKGYNEAKQGTIAAGAGRIQVVVTSGFEPTGSWVAAS